MEGRIRPAGLVFAACALRNLVDRRTSELMGVLREELIVVQFEVQVAGPQPLPPLLTSG